MGTHDDEVEVLFHGGIGDGETDGIADHQRAVEETGLPVADEMRSQRRRETRLLRNSLMEQGATRATSVESILQD